MIPGRWSNADRDSVPFLETDHRYAAVSSSLAKRNVVCGGLGCSGAKTATPQQEYANVEPIVNLYLNMLNIFLQRVICLAFSFYSHTGGEG